MEELQQEVRNLKLMWDMSQQNGRMLTLHEAEELNTVTQAYNNFQTKILQNGNSAPIDELFRYNTFLGLFPVEVRSIIHDKIFDVLKKIVEMKRGVKINWNTTQMDDVTPFLKHLNFHCSNYCIKIAVKGLEKEELCTFSKSNSVLCVKDEDGDEYKAVVINKLYDLICNILGKWWDFFTPSVINHLDHSFVTKFYFEKGNQK